MELLTSEIRERLLSNGRLRLEFQTKGEAEPDFLPVVKLFTPDAGCTWLLTELDPEQPDIAFGLCDLGQGFPELGRVGLAELEALRGPGGLRIERDLFFKPVKTLQAYADEAAKRGSIDA